MMQTGSDSVCLAAGVTIDDDDDDEKQMAPDDLDFPRKQNHNGGRHDEPRYNNNNNNNKNNNNDNGQPSPILRVQIGKDPKSCPFYATEWHRFHLARKLRQHQHQHPSQDQDGERKIEVGRVKDSGETVDQNVLDVEDDLLRGSEGKSGGRYHRRWTLGHPWWRSSSLKGAERGSRPHQNTHLFRRGKKRGQPGRGRAGRIRPPRRRVKRQWRFPHDVVYGVNMGLGWIHDHYHHHLHTSHHSYLIQHASAYAGREEERRQEPAGGDEEEAAEAEEEEWVESGKGASSRVFGWIADEKADWEKEMVNHELQAEMVHGNLSGGEGGGGRRGGGGGGMRRRKGGNEAGKATRKAREDALRRFRNRSWEHFQIIFSKNPLKDNYDQTDDYEHVIEIHTLA